MRPYEMPSAFGRKLRSTFVFFFDPIQLKLAVTNPDDKGKG